MACRCCSQVGLNEIVNLGTTPLANSLLREPQLNQAEPAWPLVLVWCPSCSLAQITETVPPESMFREYAYFSSCSDTMVAHARAIAERLVPARHLDSNSLVVEIASNDGYLLQWYQQQQIPVLGIEPARNIAQVAVEQRGVPTISEFFGVDLAGELAAKGQMADVIHANNVLAHVPDLNGVVEGF
ncbi:MAG: methyltransferase domain-containing protein, partial [Planctomycetaceae bacterium]|nr:methyltransferase domain-containing protein [Planctomycetaceae bacterium]